MAQTGYTPILIYSSSTTTNAPSAGNLTNSTLGSELAINITDGKLFYKDNANAVQVIAWKTTPTTAGGTGLTSYTAGDMLYYASGTALSKLAIGTAGQWLGSSGTAPQWNAPAALTKTDDTNVTLTLGGSASTALLNAASLTLGWTGTLAVSRGGTGTGTAFTAGSIIFAGTSGVYSQDNANLFWNDANNRLGVGTAAPNRNVEFAFSGGTTLGVSNSAQGAGILYGRIALYSTGFSNTYIDYGGEIRSYSGGGVDYSDLRFYTAAGATSAERVRIFAGGGVSIGDTTDPGAGNLRLGTGNLVVGTSGKGIADSSNVDRVSVASGVTVVNESGADIDFRVEGDTDANTLFVDAGNNRVGVGTNVPSYRFNVAIAGRGAGANYSTTDMEASTVAFIDAGENDLAKASTLTLRQFNSAGSIAVGYTATFTGFMDLGVSNGVAQTPVQRMRIGAGGEIYFPGVGTTASAANAFLNNGSTPANQLLRSTSSIRYKTNVEDLENNRSQAILNLRPVWYRSLAQADRKDWSWYGLIAEEVAKVEPRLVHWTYPESEYEEVEKDVEVDQTTTDDQGNEVTEKVTQTITERQLKPNAKLVPDGVQYDRLTVMLLDIVKQQNKLIESLDARIAALEGK